jgi:hypothetical protein
MVCGWPDRLAIVALDMQSRERCDGLRCDLASPNGDLDDLA